MYNGSITGVTTRVFYQCAYIVFLKICRTGINGTWSEHLVMGQEVKSNELPKISLATLKTRQLTDNNNNISFYCRMIIYP